MRNTQSHAFCWVDVSNERREDDIVGEPKDALARAKEKFLRVVSQRTSIFPRGHQEEKDVVDVNERPNHQSFDVIRTRASPKKVVVLGGGFGGLYCALKLDALSWREKNGEQPKPIVTLIDANETFLFKPLMYELLTLDMEETEVALAVV